MYMTHRNIHCEKYSIKGWSDWWLDEDFRWTREHSLRGIWPKNIAAKLFNIHVVATGVARLVKE